MVRYINFNISDLKKPLLLLRPLALLRFVSSGVLNHVIPSLCSYEKIWTEIIIANLNFV